MKKLLKCIAALGLLLLLPCLKAVGADSPVPDDAAVRQLLVQVITSKGAAQQKLLGDIGETGSKIAGDVLTAWTRDEVYLYPAPDGTKVPVLLEDAQDASGKARALRIIDGQVVKDASGKDLRFGDSELDTADTDMSLRTTISRTIDTLSLSSPDVDSRWSAVNKLGNSQKPIYIPILQARLAKETDATVKRAIMEGIATLQLNDPEPAVQIAAVKQLQALNSIGNLDNLQRLAADPKTGRDVVQAANLALGSIQRHVWFVNFYGTIFHGLSLGPFSWWSHSAWPSPLA